MIAVGLDKNTDSGNKIFANINGTWEPNATLKGSLMIRPVFGKGNGSGEITSIETLEEPGIYPNPSQGVFFLSTIVDRVEVIDLTGRKVTIESEIVNNQTQITLLHPETGIYLLKTYQQNRWVTRKILVK